MTIGLMNAGIGQRHSYGNFGCDYSINIFTLFSVSTLWANVNALGYLSSNTQSARPYLGVGVMQGLGFGMVDLHAWHHEPFKGAKAFAGCEFKSDTGRVHFFEIGSLIYPLPFVTGRYGFGF